MHSQNIYSDIIKGDYECVICLNPITPKSSIWSCKSCYRSFDVKCIKEWGYKAMSSKNEWNCPHCLALQVQKVCDINYRCWCGKHKNPYSKRQKTIDQVGSQGLFAPHSCGQTCGAKTSCPHPCPLTCHAGAHADPANCMFLGPRIKCYCGKHSEKVICSQSRYSGFSCQKKCGKVNPICKHKCQQVCHAASTDSKCGSCDKIVEASCYCGVMKDQVKKCCELTRKQRSKLRSGAKIKISCGNLCGELLSCGQHRCQMACHSPATNSHDCKLTPFQGETCFCGKTESLRSSCLDPKLSCGKICASQLRCGHLCGETCHSGDCPPCKQIISGVPCRCKATYQDKVCSDSETPACAKTCEAILSCKRHRCTTKCCEFSRKMTGVRKPKRMRNIGLDELLSGTLILDNHGGSNNGQTEAEEVAHLCLQTCGRLLSCKLHTCEQRCHAGKCGPCMATSFEEWSCSCGETVVDPPIRCGTVMPKCHVLCKRDQPCGHQAGHYCHSSDIRCPPCAQFISVPCRCGKSQAKQKCAESIIQRPPTCDIPCDKDLPCGHKCQERCCSELEACPPCRSLCNSTYSCGHMHEEACHHPETCPEVCKKILIAKCPCKTLKCPYECGEDVSIGCTDKCLAETYPRILLDAFEYEAHWLLQVQYKIRDFVNRQGQKILWFKPMNKKHRRFVHYMLEHYGLQGESVDTAENRSVCGKRTDQTRLCQTLLQHASKLEPQFSVENSLESEPCDASVPESLNEKTQPDTDGFTTIGSNVQEPQLIQGAGASAIKITNSFSILK